MAKQVFNLTGFRQFEDNLLKLATSHARRIGMAAIRAAGEPILKDYKSNTKVKSGTLQRNETLGLRSRLNRRQRKLSPKPGPSVVEVHIGTADPAGVQEEFGGRQAAHPALTPAWDKHGGEKALKVIGQKLGAGLEKAAKRMKRG